MADELLTTIRLAVDASGVSTGLTSVKRSIADLGTAVKDITEKTNAALGKVGTAELPVTAGLEKASNSVIKQTGEIEKAIATFGSVASTSFKLAYKSIEAEEIRLRGAGINPAIFNPYLEKLREIQKLNSLVAGQAATQAAQAEQLSQSKAAQQAKLLQLSEGIAANNKRVADVINAQAARELKDIKDRTAAIAAYSAEARNAELNLVHTGRGKSVGFLTDKGKDLGLQDAEINRILAGNKRVEASMAAAFAAANPNLGKMKELADASGTSVKGLNAALRQVPAQFTDIIVSLQGGQAPLTVLLQQGGQLKDVFGGIGPAARALGGYIVGLVNPFTIAAAAAGAFAYAMYSVNNKESALLELSTQLLGTGRASVSAVGDIRLLVLELNKIPGVSKASATAILSEFAKVDGLSGGLFESLGSSVADFAAATGTALPAAASKLASAFADPAKGARELEGALGTLTAAQIINIEKLAAIGDKAGAQAALMDALKIATMGLAEGAMTPLGKATDNLSNAWDGLTTSIGKSDAFRGANNMLASLINKTAELTSRLTALKPPDWFKYTPFFAPAMAMYGLAKDSGKSPPGATGTWSEGGATGSFAPTSSEIDKQVKAALDAGKSYESQASAMNKLKDTSRQLTGALAALAAENKSGSVGAAMLRDRLAGLNERINKLKDGGAAKKIPVGAFDTSVINAYSKSMADLAALQIKAGASAENLSKTQTELREIQSSPQWGAFNRRMQEEIIMAASLSQAKEDEAEKAKALVQAQEAIAKARNSAILSHAKELETINEKAQKLEDEVAMYGMSKEAIEALTTARMRDQIEILKGFGGSEEEIARINDTIAARERLAAAGAAKDVKVEKEKELAKSPLAKYYSETQDRALEMEKATVGAFGKMEDAVMKFAQTGKFSFSEFATSVIADFVKIELRANLSSIMKGFGGSVGGGLGGITGGIGGLFSGASTNPSAANYTNSMDLMSDAAGGGGGFGSIVSSLGSLFGGFFADGGNPPMGKVSVVGERGPELFVPRTPGTIIPNNQIGANNAPSTTFAPTTYITVAGGLTAGESYVATQKAIAENNKHWSEMLKRQGVLA